LETFDIMVYSMTYITAQLTGPVFQSRESQDGLRFDWEVAEQYYTYSDRVYSTALRLPIYR